MAGHDLKPLAELLGVGNEGIAAGKETSEHKLFLVLRVKSTDKATGVLCGIELDIDNDASIVRHERITLPVLFWRALLPRKKNNFGSRGAKFGPEGDDYGDGQKDEDIENNANPNPVDQITILHKQKPRIRLWSIMPK